MSENKTPQETTVEPIAQKKIITSVLSGFLDFFNSEDPSEWLPKLQAFFVENGKTIAIVLSIPIILVGGYYGYDEFLAKPKEEKAAEVIFKAQQYFSMDSSKKVLEGDGVNKGVLYVITNFEGTKTANLAHYYAGVSYLKLGDFKKAIEHLEKFKTDVKQIQIFGYGVLADAYSEAGRMNDALEYYEKAGTVFEKDESNSSEYLFRAALLAETLNKEEKALELYVKIKKDYPKTEKGNQIDKYIYRLKADYKE